MRHDCHATRFDDPAPPQHKKYKRCCLAKDEQDERALVAATPFRPTIPAEIAEKLAAYDHAEDELTVASNAAVDLVNAGKLDEAERAARDLLERFPDVHDGWDRLGMVHEARGDSRQAAECYRKVIDFIRSHPDDYDAGMAEQFAKLVERLDPPVAT